MAISLADIDKLVENEDFSRAEKLCREYIEGFPDSLDANILLGRILAIRGKPDEAIELLEDFAKTIQTNFDIHFLIGRIYEFAKEDFEKALEHYRTALSIDYQSSAVNYRIAKVYENYKYKDKGDDEAKRYYQKAVNGDTPIEDGFYCLARLEKSKRSLIILRHGLEHFPKSIKLYGLLARRYLDLFNDAEECIKVVQEAAGKEIQSDEINFIAFEACMEISRYQDAKNFLDLIDTETYESNTLALNCIRAIVLLEMGNHNEAVDLLQDIIQNDLKNEIGYKAHDVLICAYIGLGEPQKAIETFSEIPVDAERDEFGFVLYPLGYFDTEKYFVKALDLIINSSDNKKLVNLARGFQAIRLQRTLLNADAMIEKPDVSGIDLDKLEHDLRNALEFFPNHVTFNEVLGDVLYRRHEYFESTRYLIKAQIYSDKEEYIEIKALENFHSNRSRFKKFTNLVIELLEDHFLYEERFAKFIMPDVIEFLFDKQEFQKVIDFASIVSKRHWVNEKVLFNIAYSYSMVDDKKLAKKYYKEYTSTIGENQAVLNNLANIYSEEGDYSEAEKLYRRAIELGGEIAEKNLANLDQKKKKVEEDEQAWQRAAILYRREDLDIRRAIAHLFEDKLDNELIIFRSSKVAKTFDDNINQFLRDITDKKYFEVIDEHDLPTDSIVLRVNPLLNELIESVLLEEQKEKFFEELSTSLTAKELEEKYNYDDNLISKLDILNSRELATILKRDLREAVIALTTQSYKAAIILCGSIVESILLDRLLPKKETAVSKLRAIREKQNKKLSTREKTIENWDLETLLDVAYEEGIVSYNLFYWGNGIRGFRNLVHPGLEQRKSRELTISKENAEIAWNIVKRLLSEIK